MGNIKRRPALPVYIYNSVEDEWQYISCLDTIAQQNERITLSNAFADSYLFANAGRKNFYFISPVTIAPEFRTYFERLTGANATVLTPLMETPFICRNTVKDKEVFRELVLAAQNYERVEIYPYAASKHIYYLKKELEKYGIEVTLPESPLEKDLWTVSVFGSKNGFRNLIDDMDAKKDSLLMPAGKVFSSPSAAKTYAEKLLDRNQAILLKTGRGSGGHGTHIVKKETMLKDRNHIAGILKSNPRLWKKNKIIVEQFVETDDTHPVRFPSVEGYVDESGAFRYLYTCNMLVTREGSFFGMEVGREALVDGLEQKMRGICSRIGLEYAKNGYRGHFDVDMILGKNGQLYMNESNTRNTGGTDAYKITRHLLGARLFSQSFILSKFIDLPRNSKLPSFPEIVSRLSSLLYNSKTKTGLIISSEAALHEYSVTYFIAARTKEKAYAIEKKLLHYFHYQS